MVTSKYSKEEQNSVILSYKMLGISESLIGQYNVFTVFAYLNTSNESGDIVDGIYAHFLIVCMK